MMVGLVLVDVWRVTDVVSDVSSLTVRVGTISTCNNKTI